jgi:hypothetical protein
VPSIKRKVLRCAAGKATLLKLDLFLDTMSPAEEGPYIKSRESGETTASVDDDCCVGMFLASEWSRPLFFNL